MSGGIEAARAALDDLWEDSPSAMIDVICQALKANGCKILFLAMLPGNGFPMFTTNLDLSTVGVSTTSQVMAQALLAAGVPQAQADLWAILGARAVERYFAVRRQQQARAHAPSRKG